MIRVSDLRKAYGEIQAVAGVSFDIGAGETFGLLGPNGAGKTTTITMIIGALDADGGSVEIDGKSDPRRPDVRRSLGIAPQSLALYEELTGEENLSFFARLYGLQGARLKERVKWALAFAGLEDRRKSRVSTYSGGMKRRINLACALVHDPPVLLLDEPTVGVDPQSRNHIFESIETLRKEGKTILYTTHYMEEAQRLCDRVAIMDNGQILALDNVPNLIRDHGGHSVVQAEFETLPSDWNTYSGRGNGNQLRLETDQPLEDIAHFTNAGGKISQLNVERPNLESVFLALTGRKLRD